MNTVNCPNVNSLLWLAAPSSAEAADNADSPLLYTCSVATKSKTMGLEEPTSTPEQHRGKHLPQKQCFIVKS